MPRGRLYEEAGSVQRLIPQAVAALSAMLSEPEHPPALTPACIVQKEESDRNWLGYSHILHTLPLPYLHSAGLEGAPPSIHRSVIRRSEAWRRRGTGNMKLVRSNQGGVTDLSSGTVISVIC